MASAVFGEKLDIHSGKEHTYKDPCCELLK